MEEKAWTPELPTFHYPCCCHCLPQKGIICWVHHLKKGWWWKDKLVVGWGWLGCWCLGKPPAPYAHIHISVAGIQSYFGVWVQSFVNWQNMYSKARNVNFASIIRLFFPLFSVIGLIHTSHAWCGSSAKRTFSVFFKNELQLQII